MLFTAHDVGLAVGCHCLLVMVLVLVLVPCCPPGARKPSEWLMVRCLYCRSTTSPPPAPSPPPSQSSNASHCKLGLHVCHHGAVSRSLVHVEGESRDHLCAWGPR